MHIADAPSYANSCTRSATDAAGRWHGTRSVGSRQASVFSVLLAVHASARARQKTSARMNIICPEHGVLHSLGHRADIKNTIIMMNTLNAPTKPHINVVNIRLCRIRLLPERSYT